MQGFEGAKDIGCWIGIGLDLTFLSLDMFGMLFVPFGLNAVRLPDPLSERSARPFPLCNAGPPMHVRQSHDRSLGGVLSWEHIPSVPEDYTSSDGLFQVGCLLKHKQLSVSFFEVSFSFQFYHQHRPSTARCRPEVSPAVTSTPKMMEPQEPLTYDILHNMYTEYTCLHLCFRVFSGTRFGAGFQRGRT